MGPPPPDGGQMHLVCAVLSMIGFKFTVEHGVATSWCLAAPRDRNLDKTFRHDVGNWFLSLSGVPVNIIEKICPKRQHSFTVTDRMVSRLSAHDFTFRTSSREERCGCNAQPYRAASSASSASRSRCRRCCSLLLNARACCTSRRTCIRGGYCAECEAGLAAMPGVKRLQRHGGAGEVSGAASSGRGSQHRVGQGLLAPPRGLLQ